MGNNEIFYCKENEVFYTKEKIIFYLLHYKQLEEAVLKSCSFDASEASGVSIPSKDGFRISGLDSSLLCIKCDLDSALASLPLFYKSLIICNFIYGMSHIELAQVTKINRMKISVFIRSGIKLMQNLLEGPQDESE